MILAIHLHLVPKLRVSATMPPLPLHAIIAWSRTTLPLPFITLAARKQPNLSGSNATRIYCSITEQTEMFMNTVSLSSHMCHRITWYKFSDISDNPAPSIII